MVTHVTHGMMRPEDCHEFGTNLGYIVTFKQYKATENLSEQIKQETDRQKNKINQKCKN